jgi:hypothetical protein
LDRLVGLGFAEVLHGLDLTEDVVLLPLELVKPHILRLAHLKPTQKGEIGVNTYPQNRAVQLPIRLLTIIPTTLQI